MEWTDRDEHTLKSLYALGWPIRRISGSFHRSRHAIMMKAKRMGLAWGGVRPAPVPRVRPHEDPIILSYAQEQELRRGRPSRHTSGYSPRTHLPGPELREIPHTTQDSIKTIVANQTQPVSPDECGCQDATGSGIKNREGFTICLKCRLPRKRL